jgi:hypothetical protein
MCEHRSPSERMANDPHIGSPVRFELHRSGAQSRVLAKIGVSGFLNRMVRFCQIQPSPTACTNDGDMANLHPNASMRGKARTVANSGASGGGDE